MIPNKQNKLSTSIFALEQLRSYKLLGHSAAVLITETLTDQAGEISTLERQLEEKTFYLKRAEEFRDYWGSLVCQLLEIDMEDLDFQVIDGVDIERITQKAQSCILAFDAKVLAANKIASSFQQAKSLQNIERPVIPLKLVIDVQVEIPPVAHCEDTSYGWHIQFPEFGAKGANNEE